MKSTSSTMMPVRPGTISSTLATAAAQSAARAIRPRRVVASSAACASRKAANAMNTLCVMCALNTTGSSCVPLSHPLRGEQAEPEQIRQDERHEHRREEGGDAALAPARLAQQKDQRRDQQQPQRLGQRIEHVAGGADRVKRAHDEQRKQRERQPRRPDCREPPRASPGIGRRRSRRAGSDRAGCCPARPTPGWNIPAAPPPS